MRTTQRGKNTTAHLTAQPAATTRRRQIHQAELPELINASAFCAHEGFQREYHIHGVLPQRGKLVFAAPAKTAKSLWAMQLGLALASGHSTFLGLRLGPSAKVVYVQSEIDDGEVQRRLRRLLQTIPSHFNADQAAQQFHIRRLGAGAINLNHAATQHHIATLLRAHKPGVVVLDPFIFSFPGIDENKSCDVSRALSLLTDWTMRYHCAVILIHHTGKNGTYRGSSVLEGWPETLLQAHETSQHGILEVTGHFRCMPNPGKWYWRLPNQDDAWFSRTDT